MTKEIHGIADLTPDPTNANKGTERGRYMVEASLRETGAGRSIVADKAGRVIAGNKTLEAWAEIGGEIQVVRTDGKKLVVVQRDDLDLADEIGAARKLAYFDNRSQETSLSWDAEQILADIESGLDLSAMFFENELDDIIMSNEQTEIQDVEGGDRNLGDKSKQIKAVLYADEITDFERAIKATGEKNRGIAILEVCRHFLETHAKGQLYTTLEGAA